MRIVHSCAPFFVLLLCACPPSPVPPVNPPDASDAAPPRPVGDALPPQTPCQAACSVLAALGCPEGVSLTCGTVLAHIDGARDIPTPCGSSLCPSMSCEAIALVKTPSEAKAQGVPCGQ